MLIENCTARFDNNCYQAEPDISLDIEARMSIKEYNQTFATGDMYLTCKKMFENYFNASKKNDKKPHFGGYFTINGEDVYITKVIYSKPVVIVFWSDNTKTRATCDIEDIWNTELGLSLCVMKKLIGQENVSKLLNDWSVMCSPAEITDTDDNYPPKIITLKDVRKAHKEDKELIELRKLVNKLVNDKKE